MRRSNRARSEDSRRSRRAQRLPSVTSGSTAGKRTGDGILIEFRSVVDAAFVRIARKGCCASPTPGMISRRRREDGRVQRALIWVNGPAFRLASASTRYRL